MLCAAAGALASCGESAPPPTSSTTTTSTIPPAVHRIVPLTDLQLGHCFDRPADGNDRRFVALVVDCRSLHTYEVYSAEIYSDDEGNGSYPGENTVRETTETECFDKFEDFVGEPWIDSSHDLHTFWPTELSWANGDRKLLCAITPVDRVPRAGSAIVSRDGQTDGDTGGGTDTDAATDGSTPLGTEEPDAQ